jgi:fumarylpyruvate hydrolase
MNYAFPPPPPAHATIVDSDAVFPIHRVYCVGRNFADHTREMGKDPQLHPPFFFLKPADAVLSGGGTIAYPPSTGNFQHEIELVVALGAGGLRIPALRAEEHIFGYAVGMDLTRRDLQLDARENGRPWEVGKTFNHSGPIGAIVPASRLGHPESGKMRLTVNGEVRQQADIKEHVWSVPRVIEHLSQFFELAAGDLIFMGTPAGVSSVEVGDQLVASIDGLGELRVNIGPRS